MKRFLLCTLAVLVLIGTVCLLTFFSQDAPHAYALSNTSSRLYVAKKESAGVPSDIILISQGDHYTLYLPGSADPTKLFFTWGEDTTVKDSEGNTLLSGAAPIAMPGESVTYNVNDGNRTIYTQQGSRDIQAMFLETDTSLAGFSSFAAVNEDRTKETKAAGTMVFDGEGGYYFSIKGRGNSTWNYSHGKKPYNITLYKDNTYAKKKAVELMDGVEAKSWSLLANEGDQSLLRNKLGYDLANALGVGLRSEFVDLYVDGEYLGNYLMTPKSDYLAPDEGFIVEIDNYIDNEDPQFTLDGLEEYHPTEEGFQNRVTVKDNGADLPIADIQSYMQAAWDAILDEDSDDYLNYIDLDSWAKYYLLHEFYKSFDVVCGSILMHRDGTAPTDKLIAGPVWDLDNALGRNNNNQDLGNDNVGVSKLQQHCPEGWYIQNVTDPEGWRGQPTVPTFWLQQLGKHDSFMARVRELYLENSALFQSAAAMVDQDTDRLSASARMNFDLHGYYNCPSYLSASDACGCVATRDWEDYVYNLRNFVFKRADFLSTGFRAVTIRLQYDRATGGNTIVTLDGAYGSPYGTLPTPSKDGYVFQGWYTGENGTGQKVTGESLISIAEDHSLYAYWTPRQTQPTTTTTTAPTTSSSVNTTTTAPTVPTVPGTSSTAPTVPGTSAAPTVPGTSSTAPTVPGTSAAPTVPDTSSTAPTVPDVSATAPTVPGGSTAATTLPAPTTPAPTVPAATTTVPTTVPEVSAAPTAAPTTASSTTNTPNSTSVSDVGGAEKLESTNYTIAFVLLGVLLVGVAAVTGFFFYKNKKKG